MKPKIQLILLLFCLFLCTVFLVNRDVMRYDDIFVYRRSFSPGTDTKGDYHLSPEQFVLKPGNYQLLIEGSFSENGSGCYLIDSGEEKFFASDFPSGGTELQTNFSIDKTKQLRFGVSYDPASGELRVEKLRITSNHVFYKESLIRHALITLLAAILFILLTLRIVFPNIWKKWFPHLSRPENEKMFLFLCLLTLLTMFPFYDRGTFADGDDLYFHMSQIRGIAASLKAGYFPVRVILVVLNNWGYGSGFYYPNLFLLIPAGLIAAGFHTMEAYEIFVILCSFFALLTMFLTIRRISHSETAAYSGVILYAFAAYRLIDIYYRAALGEIQAFIFIPLIVLGLYEIFNNHPERWWIFALAFTGLLGCHMISLTIAGVFTGIWALLHFRRIFSDKRIFFALLKSVVLTLLLNAYFLLPMLEQNASNDLRIKSIMLDPLHSSFGQYTPWKSLFRYFYDWNYDEIVEHIYPEWWNYGISVRYVYPGWSLLLIPVFRLLFLRKEKSPVLKLADKLNVYGFVTMIICTDIFPWKLFLKMLFRIQFSWRIMMLTTILLSISCGIYSALLVKKLLPGKKLILQLIPTFVLGLSVGLPILLETQHHRLLDMDEYRYLEPSSFIHGAEYLPDGFDRKLAEKIGDRVLCDDPGFVLVSGERKGLTFTFEYTLPEDSENAEITVPLTYYTGYHAYLTDGNGNRMKIPVNRDDHGFVSVSNGVISSGTISVRFEKTAVQFVSDLISLAAFLFCLFHIVNGRFRNHTGIISS